MDRNTGDFMYDDQEDIYNDDDLIDAEVQPMGMATMEDASQYDDHLDLQDTPYFNGNDSRMSLSNMGDNHDPAFLFSIVEEALPKTAAEAAMSQQKRIDQVEHTWERVRRWLWVHSMIEERQAAAYVRGQADATVLHLCCKLHNPPEDVIAALIQAAPDTASWTDAHGWLPLHHACANGAVPEVMKLLIDAYPAGKLQPDNQARTPLHFYATRNTDHVPCMTANAAMLADSGAAAMADRGGMLPFHYACAYGTQPAVLAVLADAYPPCVAARESHGRTPMHLAMVNAHRDASPHTIQFLLNHTSTSNNTTAVMQSKDTINARDNDRYLPLHLLALGFKGVGRRANDTPDKRANACKSLSLYLAAEPVATADFLTAIQDLPDWLQDTAVVSKHVRNILNHKIVKRFPTSILMMDGYMLIVLIVCFAVTSSNHIDLRFDPVNSLDNTQGSLVFVFIGATYFFVREAVQVASLMSMGSFANWYKDLTNWLDIGVFFMVMYYGILMSTGSELVGDDAFRSGIAFTQGLLWVAIIMFLKKTLVDFAVFVGGIFFVVYRLAAFILAAGVILLCVSVIAKYWPFNLTLRTHTFLRSVYSLHKCYSLSTYILTFAAQLMRKHKRVHLRTVLSIAR
jgi:hypothetical protein